MDLTLDQLIEELQALRNAGVPGNSKISLPVSANVNLSQRLDHNSVEFDAINMRVKLGEFKTGKE